MIFLYLPNIFHSIAIRLAIVILEIMYRIDMLFSPSSPPGRCLDLHVEEHPPFR